MNTIIPSPRRVLVAACAAVAWLALQSVEGANPPAPKAKLDPFGEEFRAKIPPWYGYKPKLPPQNVKSAKDVIDFEVTAEPREAKPGQVVRVTVTGSPAKGWHLYAMTVRDPNQDQVSSKLKFDTPGFKALPPVEENDPEGHEGAWEHNTRFTWSFDGLILPGTPEGKRDLAFSVYFQICANTCLPPTDVALQVPITVLPGEEPLTSELKKRMSESFPPPRQKVAPGVLAPAAKKTTTTTIVGLPRDYKASMERIVSRLQGTDSLPREEDLWGFMLAGMFWGFVSLITPCVFPMIPITVSYFLKQSEKEHHQPVTMALVYCGTIIIVLTIAAAALLSFFRVLSISPYMNYGLGLLFVFFALSLFGMYEIELPTFLGRFTSERESKGGYIGTVFMALTFTIISFACVAPFLGGFGGTVAGAQRPWWHAVLGGLAFSATFASPFFILALFPTLLRAMPKSGAWLNTVKVVMGFLELAAAFKFFRTGELVNASGGASLFTFDFVLGLWIALCLLCGLYLLGIYRLPHDSVVDHLSVPRMLFSFLFLGLGLYLTPALVASSNKEGEPRPSGAVYAWVDSFLLPDSRPATGQEVWTGNLEAAIAESKKYRELTGKPKLIFVDFTGKSCTNCKINERSVFSKPEIKQLFQPYLLVQLYTDIVPLEFYSSEDQLQMKGDEARQVNDAKQVNSWFQKNAFGTLQLPLYVILEPMPDGTIKIVARYDEGRINNEPAFAEFLRKPQQIGNGARAGL